MEEIRDRRAGISGLAADRAPTETTSGHGKAWEYGALLDEALGRPGDTGPSEPVSSDSADTVVAPDHTDGTELPDGSGLLDAADLLDSALVVAVTTRTAPPPATSRPPADSRVPALELTTSTWDTTDVIASDPGLRPAGSGPINGNGSAHREVSTAVITTPTTSKPAASKPAGSTPADPSPAVHAVPRPTTLEGRVDIDVAWIERPLLAQPLVLKPGASVGPPGGAAYVDNPGTIAVTFVPSGTGGDPSVGTYLVDPAEIAAAAGPLGLLTPELMAHLSGHPYESGPPTAIQMAIIDAARQAGLRFGEEASNG